MNSKIVLNQAADNIHILAASIVEKATSGHMSPMLHATLTLCGKFSLEDIKQFHQWGSITLGHRERDVQRGIENTSGPLGQGHTDVVGVAIAAKYLKHRF